jgi:geranylgeranyl diphosphate synthase type II
MRKTNSEQSINSEHKENSDHFIQMVDAFLRTHFDKRFMRLNQRSKRLGEAVLYSLFSGGKRFRPQLIGLLAKALGVPSERAIPWAAAIECIHTYSLIHDDLPCMDDDDFRRGQPTTHRQFDESTALLAGDALLTEAFLILAQNYKNTPDLAVTLIDVLSVSTGLTGMVAGQVEDLSIENSNYKPVTDAELTRIHLLKTGELIQVACVGVARIAQMSDEKTQHIARFGESLGLAFQLADDLLDYNPAAVENSSLPAVIGVTRVQERLKSVSALAVAEIRCALDEARAQDLVELINLNLNRKK